MSVLIKVLVKVGETARGIRAGDPLTQDTTAEIIKILKELFL